MSQCEHVDMDVTAFESRKGSQIPGARVVGGCGSHLMWVLEAELRSSARAVNTPHC